MAVAARSLDSAQKFKAKFGMERAYEGYEALAKDADIDVVYVGAINTAHLAIAKMMLEAGKHVLCEKPLSMNVKQTKELINLARNTVTLHILLIITSTVFQIFLTH